MRLRVYQAPNMSAAMAMVRDELGPDALILGSRSVEDGVEVTAATETSASELPAAPEPVLDPAQEAILQWHGVPGSLATKLATDDLETALERELRFAPLPFAMDGTPLFLVGPPGAGKTLTTARLATRLKLAGQDAHVITADGKRAGAAEQLAAFTRLLGLTLFAADVPAQLTPAISRRQENAPVLIDMPGLNPADPADQEFLRECHTEVGGAIALVLPAGLDPADAQELALGFKDLGATLLIATRLDQSRRLGGILAAAAAGLALTEAGTGPGVAGGLASITPAFLSQRLNRERRTIPTTLPPPAKPISAMALLARARTDLPRSTP